MFVDEHDQPVVRWAMEKAYSFEYCRPHDLPDPCLRVRMGLTHAYFHKGKLVHWWGESDGGRLDELMFEMASLFAMCTRERAYVGPHVAIVPPNHIQFRSA